MRSGIYEIRISGNKKYIGMTNDLDKRRIRHQCNLNLNKHINPHLQAAYNKYKKYNFRVIEYTDQWLEEKEIMYISLLDTTNNRKGYNITEGGTGGNLRRFMSKEKQAQRDKAFSKTFRQRGCNLGAKNGQYKGYTDEEVYAAYIKYGSYPKAAKHIDLCQARIWKVVKRYLHQQRSIINS